MAWLDSILERLSSLADWGYLAGGPTAGEPAALTALACTLHGRQQPAQGPLAWLLKQQAANGGVGIFRGEAEPAWPTAWSVLAWQTAANADLNGASKLAAASRSPSDDRREAEYRAAAKRGVDWLLAARGESLPQTVHLGHNATLIGWPWVLGTHSWMEPTAMAVLALKATGYSDHPRTREAIRLLTDRLLPEGGCNYGNTEVLGQMTRPHIEPTGLCLWALAGERDADGRIARTRDFLHREIGSQEAAASLSYGLIGLAAHGIRPPQAESLLKKAAERTLRRAPAAYRLALLALAAPQTSARLFSAAAPVPATPALPLELTRS